MSHRPEPVRARLRAERIGYLGQSANLFPHLTVEENLLLVRRLAGRSVGGSIIERLAAVGIADRARAYPGELSGGEVTRAGLAVALAADPAVVLADEPTGELDSVTEDGVLEQLLSATQGGVAVVLAGHSTAVAAVADGYRFPTVSDPTGHVRDHNAHPDLLHRVAERCLGLRESDPPGRGLVPRFGVTAPAARESAGVDCAAGPSRPRAPARRPLPPPPPRGRAMGR